MIKISAASTDETGVAAMSANIRAIGARGRFNATQDQQYERPRIRVDRFCWAMMDSPISVPLLGLLRRTMLLAARGS